jgi:hypothetical protein
MVSVVQNRRAQTAAPAHAGDANEHDVRTVSRLLRADVRRPASRPHQALRKRQRPLRERSREKLRLDVPVLHARSVGA